MGGGVICRHRIEEPPQSVRLSTCYAFLCKDSSSDEAEANSKFQHTERTKPKLIGTTASQGWDQIFG